jgi:hypothetical protein
MVGTVLPFVWGELPLHDARAGTVTVSSEVVAIESRFEYYNNIAKSRTKKGLNSL